MPSVPDLRPRRDTAAQEARLKTLAQLVATWIKRDVDAKLAASRRVK